VKKSKENISEFNFQIAPENYIKHNYLTYCNDILVSVLIYVDKHQLSSATLQFESQEKAKEFEKINQSHDDEDKSWQDWLIENGCKEAMYEAYYKHTLFSLVGDFCNYMLESINCAAKMKIAVSYALLRKPLKDTLGYIEWLYVNRNEVLELLVNGKPEDLEIKKEKAKANVEAIREKFGVDGYFDFRYEKNSETSLERIWSQASHLITTHRYAKTESGNLNFIFSNEENLRQFSDYYYLVVPHIMSYAINLIISMFEEYASINEYTKAMNIIIRHLRMMEMSGIFSFEEAIKPIKDTELPILCPRCGRNKQIRNKDIFRLLSGIYKCPRCFKKINTGRYVFDWESIEIINSEENESNE
jgi:predicted RNA-binding Zn-ribbon protein involved in translation (DUF1610 family)